MDGTKCKLDRDKFKECLTFTVFIPVMDRNTVSLWLYVRMRRKSDSFAESNKTVDTEYETDNTNIPSLVHANLNSSTRNSIHSTTWAVTSCIRLQINVYIIVFFVFLFNYFMYCVWVTTHWALVNTLSDTALNARSMPWTRYLFGKVHRIFTDVSPLLVSLTLRALELIWSRLPTELEPNMCLRKGKLLSIIESCLTQLVAIAQLSLCSNAIRSIKWHPE